MITLFDLLIAAALLGFVYWGWLVGFQAAVVAALEIVACLAIAVVLHEPVAGFMQAIGSTLYGDAVSQSLCVLLAFGGLAWGTFAALRFQFHKTSKEEDESGIDPLSDRLGGALAGFVGGAIFVGGMLVTLAMVPFLAALKPSGDRLVLDVGKLALRTVGQFCLEQHEGRSLPLWGEPPSRITVASARLTSEPWVDCDDDGSFSDADRYRDVDGNGIFTKDLYFADVDGDGLRRIGLIDKYVAGCWDASLQSDDRPRPVLKKTEAPKPVVVETPVPPAPAPKAAVTKPDRTKPGLRDSSKPTQPEEKIPDDDF